ncbi:MAG TPA: immunoglobulin domain-containing protein [Verrucomicrobiae bacterium]|nr:immunoglobulin domain-containing protein [Verrucomicrobiae bacterium]
MNNPKLSDSNVIVRLLCVLLLALAGTAEAATINNLGSNAPAPGPDDQYVTNFVAFSQSPPPGGGAFNYYVNANPAPGQTFTTGNNPDGYVLNGVALFDADNTGGGFGNEAFSLGVYSVSNGTNAALLTTYTSQSVLLTNFTWFQWSNLGLVLQPNTQYAYAMWANGAGWMNLGNTNLAYAGGQVAVVPRGGGTMTFSSSSPWNASFDVQLTAITIPVAGQPKFSPYPVANPGASVTASAPVTGPGPYFFQWQTDGGGGGSFTNIPGATTSNLVINTTGYAAGNYSYLVLVSNNTSGVSSPAAVLTLQPSIGIPGVIGVKFGFTNGYATADALFPADNTGVPTGQIVPPANVALTEVGNWNNLLANVQAPQDSAARAAAINQVWTVDHDSTGAALSGVTLSPSGFNDGWFSGGTECAAGRLLYDCWKINGGGSSPQLDGAGHPYGTLVFNNLPWTKYDVVVYVNDNNGNYWGNMQANDVIAQGSGNVDNTSFGFNGASADPCGLATPLHTFGAYNGGNSANSCNYIKMANVNATGGSITISVVSFGGGDMGISGVELVPDTDLNLVQDVVPNYVEAVSGGTLALSSGFSETPPVELQWLKISGGVTNQVTSGITVVTNNGVVTSTLTINSLQVSDTASYQVKAVNAGNSSDYTYTSEAPVIVTDPPAPVNNIAQYKEAQVGVNYYPPDWSISTNTDLIYGFPISDGSPGTALASPGNYGADGAIGDPTVLADGMLSSQALYVVSCGPASSGNGSNIVYTLQTNSAPLGFDLTNITVYGGWLDSGRRDQEYQVLYATVADPTNFIPLSTVLYLPDDPTGEAIASRTKLVPANGVLAHNVCAVMINWDVQQLLNNYSFYSEIEINGTNSTSAFPVAPIIQPISVSGGNLVLTGSGGYPPNSPYEWLSTTNLTPPVNWVTNLSSTLDSNGAFSDSIPINSSEPARFFRLRVP